MIIELHILQNFAPSNLNRDDTNSPKNASLAATAVPVFPASASSALSGKYFKNNTTQCHLMSFRTNSLVKELSGRLVKAGKMEEDARKAA